MGAFNYNPSAGEAPRKLAIWRNTGLDGLPVVQQAAFKYDAAYAIATPVRLWSGTHWQALATASGTDVYSSTDGKTWTLRTLPYTQLWRGIATNGSTTICTGGTNTTQAGSSVNGTSWSANTLGVNADWGQCAYGAGNFVVVTNGTSTATQYSANGTSGWTAGATPGIVSKITFLNDRFFVGNAGLGSYYSTDGTTWSATTGGLSVVASMAFGGGIYAGIKSGSVNVVYYSTDGIAFTTAVLPVIDTWADIQFDTPSGLFVLVASTATGVVLTSPDCITWTQRKNYDVTTGAAAALQGPTGLAIQQNGGLRFPDRGATEITYLL